MIVEKKLRDKEDNEEEIPRKKALWVDDLTVKNCYNCDSEFSFFLRRHHCRLCGKIFCYECSDHRQEIPDTMLSNHSKKTSWKEYLGSYITNIDHTKYRTCLNCNNVINKVNSVTKLITVFNELNLDIKELKNVGKVCKLWKFASNYCLSIIREVQYKLPVEEFNKEEIRMLWKNSEYMAGHSRYILALLKVCKTDEDVEKVTTIIKKPKRVSCRNLMCTRNCCRKLTAMDSINLLVECFKKVGHSDKVKTLALKHLVCSDKEFKCYIPLLVYNIRNDDGMIAEFLIQRCFMTFDLLNSLYWEIQLYPKDDYHQEAYSKLLDDLKELFQKNNNETKFIKLLQGTAFVEVIKKIGKSIGNDKKSYDQIKDSFKLNGDTIYPLDPKIKIKELLLEKIQIKDSFSKPIILPCITSDNKHTKLMYKHDDLRKDQIVMNIINLMDIIVKKEEKLDLGIVTYNILPIDSESGIIEIVDDADTVYFIQEKIKSSILNYILEKNGNIKIKDLREKYIRSTAAYCVITYLLGIGDRHLDNIMVTRDGRLFHIDFGYILGRDPKFTNPSIRITPEIVEALGGFSSEYYPYFKELCTKIFNCLRRNIDIFMNLLLLLPEISDLDITEEEVKKQIYKRFLPGENSVDAQFHLVKKLEEHNITDRILDFCHYHSRERTINSTVDRVKFALSSLWNYTKKD
jgi:phosphatidylinositol 3-kinase